MKKIAMSLFVVAVALSETPAFAQFRNLPVAAKNFSNLETVITRASKGARIGRPVVSIRPGIVPGNTIGFLRVKMPQVITPVNESYARFLKKNFKIMTAMSGPSVAYPTPESFADITANEWAGRDGKHAFYESQTELAKDLDAFYGGDAEILLAPGGRQVKLYSLPVDGIVYKPVGYKDPVVLNSKDTFVIFDVETQTGQLADNVPEVYNSFKEASRTDLYGEFETYEIFPKSHTLDYRPVSPEKWYKYQRDWARTDDGAAENWAEKGYPRYFESQSALAETLKNGYYEGEVLPKVQDKLTKQIFTIYEIPVPGITYSAPGAPTKVLTPHTQVVLYSEKAGARLVDRAFLENPVFFEFVK